MKTLEQFRSELIANKELAEKLIKTTNEQEFEAILKENEVDCTNEQFKEFMHVKAKESGELSDDELSTVSGGGYWSSTMGYKSGNYPVFKVDDTAYMLKSYGPEFLRAYYTVTITKVSSEKNWLGEYTYSIRYNHDNDTENGIYESQMMTEKNGKWVPRPSLPKK